MSLALLSRPHAVPPLTVVPATIRSCGVRLLAASAQVDDAGSFMALDARIGDWSGAAASAYHDTLAPTGRRAEALSLALRGVAHRVRTHAETMAGLVDARHDLVERRGHLLAQIVRLEAEARDDLSRWGVDLQARCRQVQADVDDLDADVLTWTRTVTGEERAMAEAFRRVRTLADIDRHYGGVVDPADLALGGRPPAGASPTAVEGWWESLTPEQRQATIAAAPGLIGNVDGVPVAVRDAANRVALERDVADWEHTATLGRLTDDERVWLDNARAAQDGLAHIADLTDPVTGGPVAARLYLYDPAAFGGDGAVAISAGDLATADNVAVVTPGLGTDARSAPHLADRAATLYEASRYLDPAAANATLLWIGYDAPDNLPWEGGDRTGDDWDAVGVLTEGLARAGGERLSDLVDGLRAGRDGDPAHLTAIGYSYGSTTTGRAAHDHGLAVDDLVFVGSPGVGGDTNDVGDTGVAADHVWAGANSRDPITYLANHGWLHGEVLFGAGLGDDPAEDDFGATRFRAEDVSRPDHPDLGQHTRYFDHDTESLANLARIVNGDYGAVLVAEHLYDPWYAGVQDPELDREPTSQTTRATR